MSSTITYTPKGSVRHQTQQILHRDNGPAVIFFNGKTVYYNYGNIHRVDGPAVIHTDGTEEYWYNNKQYLIRS